MGVLESAVVDSFHQPHYRPKPVQFGQVTVSRFPLVCNPSGGYAHQSPERDEEMRDWYTMARVQEAFRLAETAGITAHLGRADEFVMRALREHWNDGGSLIWIAQTCPGVGTIRHGVTNAISGRAKCCFIHGGKLDYRVANGQTKEVFEAIAMIKDNGMTAGVAGHRTETIRWAAEHLDLDFYMCCYYNSDDRTRQSHRDYGVEEVYDELDVWIGFGFEFNFLFEPSRFGAAFRFQRSVFEYPSLPVADVSHAILGFPMNAGHDDCPPRGKDTSPAKSVRSSIKKCYTFCYTPAVLTQKEPATRLRKSLA